MSVRWKVKGIPLETVNDNGGTVGEPFAAIQLPYSKDDARHVHTIILTKDTEFYEGDEPQSSQHDHNRQVERERG